MSAECCPECGRPMFDDLGPDEEGEYTQDDYDDDEVPHVLVCINGHEWLEGAE